MCIRSFDKEIITIAKLNRVGFFLALVFSVFLKGTISACPAAGPSDKNHSEKNQGISSSDKVVIAKVADREITLQDFIERAEYTIRPPYCRGNLNNDKNIILNTLIAEKLLSLESSKDNELLKNKKFLNFISGRREQKMRALLSFHEGDMKVSLDTNEIKREFSIAGRTYKIQYFNIYDNALALAVTERFAGKDSSFERIFNYVSPLDSIPEREVSWSSQEAKMIHKALFSGKLKKGQVIGPLNLDDTTHLFIKVKGWTDRLAVTETDFNSRYDDVVEKLTQSKADSIYDRFVLNLMGDKKLDFDADVFNKLIKILAPYYLNQKEKTESEFMSMAYKDAPELPNPESLGSAYDDIKDLPVLKIDGKTWSVSDLKNEIDKHPLVFRRKNSRDKFANQLRLAVVDLIRDKYLTQTAYQRGYDKDYIVSHYEQSWLDASVALYEKDKYLRKSGVKELDNPEQIETYLNPYVKSLLKKYSDRIEVNVDEYDKIKLTRIDMFSIQADVPYKIYVPAFPLLTTFNRLNYGRKMAINKNVNSN